MHRIHIKNKVSIDKMRSAGKLLSSVMNEIGQNVVVGVSTAEIDFLFEKLMARVGLKAPCKGYGTYKHATCISVNDMVVHGVPSKDIILKSGDFVKIDAVGSFEGYCADMARPFFVGEVSPKVRSLADTAQHALDEAIGLVKPGIFLSDISAAIQNVVERAGFGVVRYFSGHGIGKSFHEAPDIPNYGKPGMGPILREGMALAIEPMIVEGSYEVKIAADGWTARTCDGGLAAHVEDTVVVTRDGVENLTRIVCES